MIDGFLETTLQQMFVPFKWNQPFRCRRPRILTGNQRGGGGEVKPVDGIKKKQRTNTFIKILAPAPKLVKFSTLLDQFLSGKLRAECVERLVSDGGVGLRNDADKRAGHGITWL